MSDEHEPVDPELAETVQVIARDFVARYGADQQAEQLARRAYAYLNVREFAPLWAAACRAYASQSRSVPK